MELFTSVVKNKFFPLHFLIISSSPGSKIGKSSIFSLFQFAILSWFKSTTLIFNSGHLLAITAIVGPPT